MAAFVGKYAANKLLKKQMAKYEHKKVQGGEVSQQTPPLHPRTRQLTSPI
jgi:hypothetical protein